MQNILLKGKKKKSRPDPLTSFLWLPHTFKKRPRQPPGEHRVGPATDDAATRDHVFSPRSWNHRGNEQNPLRCFFFFFFGYEES